MGHTNLKGGEKAGEDNSKRHDESSRVKVNLFDGARTGARTLTASTDGGAAGGIDT